MYDWMSIGVIKAGVPYLGVLMGGDRVGGEGSELVGDEVGRFV